MNFFKKLFSSGKKATKDHEKSEIDVNDLSQKKEANYLEKDTIKRLLKRIILKNLKI